MPSAQQHRRAANQIKKRFRSKFPDASNLLPRRQILPPEFATRGPPAKSVILATSASPTYVFPGIGAETEAGSSPTTSTTLSTQTSTSSAATSTSTTTITTTSTSTSASTTPTKTKPVKTGPPTTAVTTSVTTSFTSTSAEAAVTSSAAAVTSTSSSSNGAVAGGVIAAILAVAGIVFAIFFIRRKRKRQAEENAFDAKDFRPSAMLMPDPPTHEDTIAHGFNPSPPSMIERRLESPPATFGPQYGTPAPLTEASAYGEYYAGYNPGAQFASFAPGQVVNYSIASKPLPNPFATPATTQFGPIASPIAGQGQYEQQAYNEYPSLTRKLSDGSTTTYPVLTRQSSLTNPHQENVVVLPPIPVTENAIPDNDYVDLSRSSVSPFQAAQYAEISRRLRTEVPSGLTTPEAAQPQFALAPAVDRDLPPLPLPKDDDEDGSPFADPVSIPNTPTMERLRVSTASYNQQQQHEGELRPISTAGSELSQEVDFPQDLDFPAPPSPVHTVSSRYRVDSTPPSLPEILVESRVSVGSYEFAPPPGFVTSPLGSGFPSGVSASGFMNRFPATPSPLASSFGIITPRPEETGFKEAYITPPPSAKKEKLKESSLKRSNTVYSLYDGEDAYGGI